MGKKTTVNDFEIEMEEELQERREHFKSHRDLIRLALGLTKFWPASENGRKASVSYSFGWTTINCVSLNLTMGPEDTIQDVQNFLDDYVDIEDSLKFSTTDEYLAAGWVGWKYTDEKGNRFMVRAFFEASNDCKLVGTGKFEEVMEFVCSESAQKAA